GERIADFQINGVIRVVVNVYGSIERDRKRLRTADADEGLDDMRAFAITVEVEEAKIFTGTWRGKIVVGNAKGNRSGSEAQVQVMLVRQGSVGGNGIAGPGANGKIALRKLQGGLYAEGLAQVKATPYVAAHDIGADAQFLRRGGANEKQERKRGKEDETVRSSHKKPLDGI